MAMVSSSLGPIISLLDKLYSLCNNKLLAEPEFTDFRYALHDLKQDLLPLCERGMVTSIPVQIRMKRFRELAYDIEDWIDGLLIHYWGRFKLKWWPWHRIRIQKFRDRIRDIYDHFACYGVHLGELESTENPEAYKPWEFLPKHGGEKPCFFGLGRAERMLVKHLVAHEPSVKVICILGQAGIGKTTLAREVFRKHQNQFHCKAFVSVGSKSTDATLMEIARQVMPSSTIPCDEKLISTELREFLATKRYLIVVDDVWNVQSWSHIRYVMRENDLGSRVLVTTEIKQVANSCGVKHIDFIYTLKARSDRDSRSLILGRIKEIDKDCRVDSKVLENMIKVCGGNPLSLVVAAGLLATGCEILREPGFPERAILSPVNQDCTSQVMNMLLDISYAELPFHVKSCFLYFSTFPENCTIEKDRLIRRWIAEGFIPKTNEESLWQIGETYFNELASMKLIQPVLDDDGDETIGCIVHGVIRDFIVSSSCEDNFVTLGAKLRLASRPRGTIRRLSLDCYEQDEVNALATRLVQLSRLRSFTTFGNAKKQMPDLSAFRLLRVLDFEDNILGYDQLKSIGNLSLLRYLGLRGTGITKIPKHIMELKDLTTLDLRRTMVTHLPHFKTAKLASLLVDCLKLRRGIGEMPYLEELSTVIVNSTSPTENPSKTQVHGSGSLDNIAQLIGKSKQLRMLAIRFDGLFGGTETYRREGLMRFFDEVAKSGVQSLIVHDYPCNLVDFLVDCWSCTKPNHLRKFELRIAGHLSNIPRKIASLACLTHLHIKVNAVEAECLRNLGKLPNLVLLNMILESGTPKRCIITRDCFQSLKIFWYTCRHCGMGLQFEHGAMPQLQSLRINFGPVQTKSSYGDFSFGIQYLSHLARVDATMNSGHARALEMKAAEAAIRQQVSQNPNRPELQLRREEGRIRGGKNLPIDSNDKAAMATVTQN